MESSRNHTPDSPQWRRWKAEGSNDQRIEYWKEVICEAVLDAEMTLPAPEKAMAFDGSIHSLSQAGARFINFRSSAHQIRRTHSQVDRNDNAYFMIGLQRRGCGLMTQAGSSVSLRPGDVGILDSGLPFDLQFPDAVDRCVVMLPKPLLEQRMSQASLGKGPLCIGSGSILSPMLGHLLHALTQQDRPIGQANVHFMLQSLADYLAQCLEPSTPKASEPETGRAQFDNAISHVSQHLTSSELSAATTAIAIGSSLRTVHRLFNKFADCTFEQYVIRQRLSLARQRLASGAAGSVSDAAFDAGFNDLSHFTRRFRTAFGVRPSALLKRQ